MLNTKKSIVLIKSALCIAIVMAVLFSCFAIPARAVAFAANNVYTDVLDDLQNDTNFNIDDYPITQTDFSLQLIQLAESTANELLAYVYQPSAGKFDILAKKIRISLSDDNTHYQDFNLTFLTRHGQFYKYKVDGYVTDVSSNIRREYTVLQLMRSADSRCNDRLEDENHNIISMVPYTCGYTFTVETKDGEVYYGKSKTDYSVVTAKYCGQLEFNNPINKLEWLTGVRTSGMLHFIAFSGKGIVTSNGETVEIDIEDLRKADVAYTLTEKKKFDRTYTLTSSADEHWDLDISSERIERTLDSTVEESYRAGIFAHKYTWNEIMTVEEFINEVVEDDSLFFSSTLTPAAASEFSDMQYVLCLCVTDRSFSHTVTQNGYNSFETTTYIRSYINDETILGLEFESEGKVYNLGTVDNYQTGDGVPDNEEDYGLNEEFISDWFDELMSGLSEAFRTVLIVIAIIAFIAILIVLGVFIEPVGKLFKFIFKIIVAVISAPFKFFGWLFGGGKGSKRRACAPTKYKNIRR